MTVQMCVAIEGAYFHKTSLYKTLYIVKDSGQTLIVRRDMRGPNPKVTYEVKSTRRIPINRRAARIDNSEAADLLAKWTAPIPNALFALTCMSHLTLQSRV